MCYFIFQRVNIIYDDDDDDVVYMCLHNYVERIV